MIKRVSTGMAAALVAALAAPMPLAAQDADRAWPPAGVSYHGDPGAPDISGLWLGTTMGVPGGPIASNTGKTADGRPPSFLSPWPLPYTPEFKKMSDERAAAAKAGKQIGDTGSKCLPFGIPFLMLSEAYPNEVVQTPGQVSIFFFTAFPVIVWTDGRGHPADLKPSYNGHSIGHWVGDTLYVDTVGLRGDTPLETHFDPHSDKFHFQWTMRRVGDGVMHVHFTLFDGVAFTEPVESTNIWHRKTDYRWAMLDDQSCFENAAGVSTNAKAPEEGFMKF
ncbi:hypothetical protein [Sphingomonas bacterium]|uniref:hypothetical protein n=1 Tax=Sphingomonas bacterium TaxID=1895847 RepID=UPI0015768D70|nr:hypothetical protein [Sphingomonas bacterium]